MNLQIVQAIKQKTDAEVTYSTDAAGVTTYALTKLVNGKPHTVEVAITAAVHAAVNATTLAEEVYRRAAELFAALRKQVTESKVNP